MKCYYTSVEWVNSLIKVSLCCVIILLLIRLNRFLLLGIIKDPNLLSIQEDCMSFLESTPQEIEAVHRSMKENSCESEKSF